MSEKLKAGVVILEDNGRQYVCIDDLIAWAELNRKLPAHPERVTTWSDVIRELNELKKRIDGKEKRDQAGQ